MADRVFVPGSAVEPRAVPTPAFPDPPVVAIRPQVKVAASSTVRVRVTPGATTFAVVVLYQWDKWDNKMPLGFMVVNRGSAALTKTFTLEADAVAVTWEEGGRYYHQTEAGLPYLKGTLTYPALLAAPTSVEIF